MEYLSLPVSIFRLYYDFQESDKIVYLVIQYNYFILQGRKKTQYPANRVADNSRGQKNDNWIWNSNSVSCNLLSKNL